MVAPEIGDEIIAPRAGVGAGEREVYFAEIGDRGFEPLDAVFDFLNCVSNIVFYGFVNFSLVCASPFVSRLAYLVSTTSA